MAEQKEILMTAEGLAKLQEEHEQLVLVRRKEISEKIKVARGFGDLSENAEYDEAKNEQAQVEARIAQIEQTLKVARVVEEKDMDADAVSVGSSVKVHDMDFDEDVVYKIVGPSESDPMNDKLSYESPVGHALLGKKIGDIVDVEAPDGVIQFKILDIIK